MVPKVFIIILNWNNWEDTLECLESLGNINYPNYQIVIIDNGSEKEFRFSDPRFLVIYNHDNLGFSGGNNVGIKYAMENKADYILLLNNDTVVNPDFLTRLIKIAEVNENFAFLGPKIYHYHDKDRIWYAGGKISPFSVKGYHIGLNEKDQGQYEKIRPVDYITGCCLLARSDAIKKIGLLDEDYFLYYEDTDWSWRAHQNGYLCVFVPQAKIWHKCNGNNEQTPSSLYYHSRNGMLLVKKNGPLSTRISSHILSSWITVKQLIKLMFFPKKRSNAKYILLGIKDFYFKKYGRF